jgi:pyruvate formate lyase activating enzyme
MKIVSKNESTIDYPGKFGQILFCAGCNFRCGFCHNPELIFENSEELNLNEIIKELKNKSESGWYESVCISGGEPTIYSDLIGFLEKLKKTKLKIKLDTNGTNPEMLKKILDKKLIDYVAMDIKSPIEKYSEIVGVNVDLNKIKESVELVKKFPEYEFRTTILPFFTKENFDKIGQWISSS